MLDTGATRTIILEDIVEMLSLKVRKLNTRIISFETVAEGSRKLTDLCVENLGGEWNFKVRNAIVGKILTTEEDAPPKNAEIQGLEYLEGVSFSELPSEEI